MSQHIVVQRSKNKKFVFGWDRLLQSFYLQVHDLTRPEDDEENPRIIAWYGTSTETELYEVEHLVQVAMEHGLIIDHPMRMDLYGEKDNGR